MDIFKKLNPYLSFGLILAVFEIILIFPKFIYIIFIPLIYVFFSLYYLSGRRFFRKDLWLIFILASLLLISGFIFLYFLETASVKQILIIFLAFSYWFSIKNINITVFSLESREEEKNIINYLCFATSFLFYSSLFALRVFLYLKIIWLLLLVFPISLLLIAEVFWANGLGIKKNIVTICIILLIILELFWGNTYLPTNFFVNGIFLSIAYYIIVNLSRHQILNTLSRKILARYLTVGTLMIIIVFTTAQWI